MGLRFCSFAISIAPSFDVFEHVLSQRVVFVVCAEVYVAFTHATSLILDAFCPVNFSQRLMMASA